MFAMAFKRLCPTICSFNHSREAMRNTRIWWQKVSFQAFSTRVQVLPERKPLLLNASEFQLLFGEGPTEAIYRGTLAQDLSQAKRGKLCEDWARQALQKINPKSEVLDAEPGTDCNGNRRGVHMAPYDFMMDGRRVEVKGARMSFCRTYQQWRISFRHIKLPFGSRQLAEFDDLYFVIVRPSGLHLVKHDLCTGVSKNGRETETSGYKVQVAASRKDLGWEEALATILRKMCVEGGCVLLQSETFHQLQFAPQAEREAIQEAYADTPMFHMCSKQRGLQLQSMGFEVDKILNPQSAFGLIAEEAALDGRMLSASNASADWIRDTFRVELKSSVLQFSRKTTQWFCRFQDIKPHLFDELWLAIYTPLGVHFYRSRSLETLHLVSRGVATKHSGFQVQVRGPPKEADPLQALQKIQEKITSKGCELLATVQWPGQ